MLGIFAEYYPEHMLDKVSQLTDLMIGSIEQQFKKTKPEFALIPGALKVE